MLLLFLHFWICQVYLHRYICCCCCYCFNGLGQRRESPGYCSWQKMLVDKFHYYLKSRSEDRVRRGLGLSSWPMEDEGRMMSFDISINNGWFPLSVSFSHWSVISGVSYALLKVSGTQCWKVLLWNSVSLLKDPNGGHGFLLFVAAEVSACWKCSCLFLIKNFYIIWVI